MLSSLSSTIITVFDIPALPAAPSPEPITDVRRRHAPVARHDEKIRDHVLRKRKRKRNLRISRPNCGRKIGQNDGNSALCNYGLGARLRETASLPASHEARCGRAGCATGDYPGVIALTSIIRRLSAILNVYPPKRSTMVTKMSSAAASQRCGVLRRGGLPNATMSTTASGTSEAIPSTTPTNRLAVTGKLKGMEMS